MPEKYRLCKLKSFDFDITKRWYIEFYALNRKGILTRYQHWIPAKLTTKSERVKYFKKNAPELNLQLIKGYILPDKQKYKPKPITPPKEAPEKLVTVLDGLHYILNTKRNARPKSLGSYKTNINSFAEFLASRNATDYPLSHFTQKEAYLFSDWLVQKGLSEVTHNARITTLKTFCKELVKREIINKNPFEHVTLLKEKQSELNIAFKETERITLENYLKLHEPRLYIYTRFIYHAFIRPTELMQLRIKDIDLSGRKIEINGNISKNGKTQIIPINNELQKIIIAMQLDQYEANDYLFGFGMNTGTKPVQRNAAYNAHQKALKSLGLYNGKHTLYSWKHTGVVNAYQKAKLDIKTLQMLLRHHSLEMTDIYLKSLGLRFGETVLDVDW